MMFNINIYVNSISYYFWSIIIIDRVTSITCRLPVTQKYHMKFFRHLFFYHDLSENIIYQKENGMNGNILRVCRCFNKNVFLHSYVNNRTNNFSKFLVKRFVWWETDWFLFEVCGAHREAKQIKEVFCCNMLIYFPNDHHFVPTTYILRLYDENQIDFKCYSYIQANAPAAANHVQPMLF